jgi:hypothetical protein
MLADTSIPTGLVYGVPTQANAVTSCDQQTFHSHPHISDLTSSWLGSNDKHYIDGKSVLSSQ